MYHDQLWFTYNHSQTTSLRDGGGGGGDRDIRTSYFLYPALLLLITLSPDFRPRPSCSRPHFSWKSFIYNYIGVNRSAECISKWTLQDFKIPWKKNANFLILTRLIINQFDTFRCLNLKKKLAFLCFHSLVTHPNRKIVLIAWMVYLFLFFKTTLICRCRDSKHILVI